jgi:hypothetical protein
MLGIFNPYSKIKAFEVTTPTDVKTIEKDIKALNPLYSSDL